MGKWVYSFGDGSAEGGASMRELLGGKGANLAEMAAIGLPVPPGFTITTDVCSHFYRHNQSYPDALAAEIEATILKIEEEVGAQFGDGSNPLLLSVRSGARVSMPGMMDTVLNLGLNAVTVEGLVAQSGNPRFAWDSYRRFVQMYSDVVLGVDHYLFEDLLEDKKRELGLALDTDLQAEHLSELTAAFKAITQSELGRPFPEDVRDQLWGAIGAVFSSWQIERARTYRRLHGISEDWGTAVTVQAMVFGNLGQSSATGVAFTRNPSTGRREYFGEYLINAQGEDVVAGIRTPQYLTKKARQEAQASEPTMEETLPEVFNQLTDVFERLETHYSDMQDIEFTVQKGKLWILQTRSGKRTATAALKIAVDMVAEGVLSESEAIMQIDPKTLDQLLHPTLDPDAPRDMLTTGLPASPGAASGAIIFDADKAEEWADNKRDVILVRSETSPEDIHGMHAARGVLTAKGGMTSHAAVVARGMGRACVSGAGELEIDLAGRRLVCNGRTFEEGDILTIDGSTGHVMVGRVDTIQPELSGDFSTLMSWADDHRTMGVRANAETPSDSRTARDFGAEGIGLCRTEHMFFDAGRITAVRQMILADDEAGRRAALDQILPEQRRDFAEIFEIMKGLPVTIRLLDPPLHEFLPRVEKDFEAVAEASGVSVAALRRRAEVLHEFNPMLGHRGCRLGVTYPEIYEMQARAIFEGAFEAEKKTGAAVCAEVMIPLASTREELSILKGVIEAAANEVFRKAGRRMDYLIGTMIELPRAALRAGDLAKEAQFFSFGTNDLTQTTYGISRDDAAGFIQDYVEKKIFPEDPFVSIDVDGVGELIKLAVARGRATRDDLKLGICGEHGGDPASINFCQETGLDYISCSAYRIPIARLAAAQAAIRQVTKP
jgi:pyruvate,orthophosphate dikinase